MLKKLEIQNYAIIDKLQLDLSKHLSIITGETGAGKSILLGALGLIMGKRADTKVLYDDAIKCFVEATFSVAPYQLKEWFDTEELDYFDEVVIRREISPQGKSRAFINDTPVTLDVLEGLAKQLIDIHQQFDTLDIQKTDYQLKIVDVLAGNKDIIADYSQRFRQYKKAQNTLAELEEKSKNALQECEFLNFQLAEFHSAQLKEGEQEELENSLEKLTAAEDIKKITSMMAHGLEEDENAITGQLQSLINHFGSIAYLSEDYQAIYDRVNAAKEELTDVAREVSIIAEKTEYDPEAIAEAQARLDLMYRLQKKHHVLTVEDLLKIQADMEAKLEGFTDVSIEIDKLKGNIQTLENELVTIGKQITKNRQSIAPKFEQNVQVLLTELSMPHAKIKVQILPIISPTPTGFDDVSLVFAPNKGSQFHPLKDTVSGGEMSRLALCIKSLLAEAMTLPTLIFDEIDSGVSGEVSMKMGEILGKLSQNHQVISITHSPQIASKAVKHYWVYKNDTAARTVTAIKELSQEERIEELAKMLSGNPPTSAAIANAKELLGL